MGTIHPHMKDDNIFKRKYEASILDGDKIYE